MSKPVTNKQKDVKTKQALMGDFFSKPNKSNSETKKGSLKRKVTGAGMFGFSWTRGAQRDTEEYREGYPGKKDHPELKDNYLFYTNKIQSKPDGDYIDDVHADWWGDYKRLEVHHGYIQWLFPIRETGLNWHAQELQLHEIKKLTKNKEAMERILKSYKMMLDFYGMEILHEENGELCRAENWKSRFQHLNRSYHNYLRITRILKCLGEFGYEHLKKNFVKFVLEEGLQDGTLCNLIDSCVKYWIGVLREKDEREEMFDYYEQLSEDDRALARSNRSVSPPIKSQKKTETGSSKQTKPKNDKSKGKKEKDSVQEESTDDEDGALYYAMSLIEDKDEKQFVENKPRRKDHDISDSDDNDAELESQEMDYWNKETTANGNEEDVNKTEENKGSGSGKKESTSKPENMANEHELEHGSDAYESLPQGDTSEENKSTGSSNNGIKKTGDTLAVGMETGEDTLQNNVQFKDMETDNIEHNEMQVADTNKDVSEKKVDNIDKRQTRARTTEAKKGSEIKAEHNAKPDKANNEVKEDDTKANGPEVMETT